MKLVLLAVVFAFVSGFSQEKIFENQYDTIVYNNYLIDGPNQNDNPNYFMVSVLGKMIVLDPDNGSVVTECGYTLPENSSTLFSCLPSQYWVDDDDGWELVAVRYDTVTVNGTLTGTYVTIVKDELGNTLLETEGYGSFQHIGSSTYLVSSHTKKLKVYKFRSNIVTSSMNIDNKEKNFANTSTDQSITVLVKNGNIQAALGKSVSDDIKVDVFDLKGKLVYNENIDSKSGEVNFDAKNLADGVYTIRFTDKKEQAK